VTNDHTALHDLEEIGAQLLVLHERRSFPQGMVPAQRGATEHIRFETFIEYLLSRCSDGSRERIREGLHFRTGEPYMAYRVADVNVVFFLPKQVLYYITTGDRARTW
jgi:hypothetical protein